MKTNELRAAAAPSPARRRPPLRGQARAHPRDRDAPLRRARLPRHAHRGHRHRALDREGLGLPALRQQGRALPRGATRRPSPPSRRTWTRRPTVTRPGLLRDAALLARADRPAGARELGPLPHRAARQLRHGPALRQEINRFLRERDPYGTAAFVRMGVERGEVRVATSTRR